jgi:glycosyltransferase involved in cell wall biosynthesis
VGGDARRARGSLSLRIAVDINDLARPLAGIGRYIQGLLSGIAEIEPGDELVLFYRDPPAIELPPFEQRRLPGSSVTWWTQVTLPRAARDARADVLLCPSVRAPIARRVPVVLVVHDVLYTVHPEYFPRFDRLYMSTLMRLVVPRCDRLVAVSEATADGVRERFRVPLERLSVIRSGVEPRFHPRERAEARGALEREGITVPERYILFAGTLEPRKNVDRLLEAFTRAGLDHTLVLAGKRGWNDDPIVAAIERTPAASYLGHVPDRAMPYLYSAADVVAYPSSHEGFGLPVLEGMASGVPVVTTKAPGVAEVAGDAAILVPPRDVTELADALVRAATDDELRADLVRRGLERAARFSWPEAARRTLEVCRQAAAS